MRAASILAVAAFGLHAAYAFAEPKVADKSYLASDSEKTWTVTAFVRTLGDEECEEGEEYTFQASGGMSHFICDGTNTIESKYTWSFETDGIDEFLSFNGTTYRLTAWTEANEDLGVEIQNLSLRVESDKNAETADIEMQHLQ